jgi:hypothetical protein
MKALNLTLLSLVLCGVLFSMAPGCVVDFPDDLPYACQEDADCGGGGYVCSTAQDSRRYCCLPEAETCNSKDDDCDGVADELDAPPCYGGPAGTLNVGICRPGKPTCGPTGNILCVGEVRPVATETCNGKDDNCDGTVDEGFDFQTGQNNCGRCDQVCTSLQECKAGVCVRRQELVCNDGIDNDGDSPPPPATQLIDCADTDCNGLECGSGCVCRAGQKSEGECGNSANDDGDTQTDCADTDCNEQPCGVGCLCLGGVRGEGQCGNGVDDDAGGGLDCADTDCNEKACGVGCICRVGIKAENQCDDGLDNDGDSPAPPAAQLIDCADTDCNNLECGVGCQCQSRVKAETACSDGLDNDGDSLIDCADPNCNNQSCIIGEPGAVCARRQCAEIRCENTLDDDRDGKIDCADEDCEGVQINATPTGRLCTLAGPKEGGANFCTDNQDNDSNGQRDCRNTGGATPDANCLTGICGVGCQYNNTAGGACNIKLETRCDDNVNNDGEGAIDCADADCNGRSCNFLLPGCICASGAKKENVCNDGLDNDADNNTDCADPTDCPSGTTCRKSDGNPGTCNASRQCV